MGGFLGGLFNGLGDRLQEKHDQAIELENTKKKGEFSTLWDSMRNTATRLEELKSKGDKATPEEMKEAERLTSQYQWSTEALNKLTKRHKPIAEALQKIGTFTQHALGGNKGPQAPKGQPPKPGQDDNKMDRSPVPAPQGQQPPQATPNPTQAFNQGPQAPAPSAQDAAAQPPTQTSPKQTFDAGPSMQGAYAAADPAAGELRNKLNTEKAEFDSWLERGKQVLGPNASPRDLAEYAGSHGTKLPTEPTAGKTPVRLKMKDGEELSAMRTKDGKYSTLSGEPIDGDAIDREAAKPSSGRPVVIGSDFTTVKDAKKMAAGNGMAYPNENGEAWDLNAIPDDMVLQAIHTADGKTHYAPRNVNDKVVTIGGKVYAVNPAEVQGISQGEGTDLGVSKTSTARTSEQVAINPVTGEVVKNTLRSSSTPSTPGATGRPVQAPGSPAAGGSQPPTAPPAGRGSQPAPSKAAGAKPTSAPSSDIKGVPPGMYNQQLNRVVPVREAATQIFGDPAQPDLKGLKDYMSLADNPQSRDRLGKALRLTFEGLNQATGGAHIAADAGPISVSTGGIGSILQNYFGVPQKLAEQQTNIMQKAIGDLTPEEKEAYDSVMSSFSTVVGLRSLTRASAAQASVAAIERELPVIGVNTFDSRQYADQLQRLAEVVSNGTKGIPKGMIDPALVDRINRLPGEMQKLKNARPAKAPTAAKGGGNVVEDLVKAYGGK